MALRVVWSSVPVWSETVRGRPAGGCTRYGLRLALGWSYSCTVPYPYMYTYM